MIVNGPPSYSPYGSSVKFTQLGPQDSKNSFWKKWGTPGAILGGILLLFGISMIPIEVSRIIRGSLNRGERGSYLLYPNYNADANSANPQIVEFMPDLFQNPPQNRYRLDQKGVVPFSALATNGVGNYPIQDKYLWPWSHAALLFSLVTIAAGGLGILSGCRRTYSSVFAFFVLSLLSALLSIFLIAYYATQVHWQLNHNGDRRKAFSFSNIDYALGSTMLALSIADCVFSFIATILAGLSLGICLESKASLTPNSLGSAAAEKREPQFIGIKPPPKMVPVPVSAGRGQAPMRPGTFAPPLPRGPVPIPVAFRPTPVRMAPRI